MSMHRSWNAVIPVWFATFALAATLLPPGNFGWSLFLLVLGLTVPAIGLRAVAGPPLQRVGYQATDRYAAHESTGPR